MRLDEIPTGPPKGVTKAQAHKRLKSLGEELFQLQDELWGAKLNSVLVVLQGRDTAGKDGTIKHVAGYLNPRGVSVVSFGVPTAEEREHDFLWRVHRHTPRMGEFVQTLTDESPRRVIVFDMPPLLASDDVLAFGPRADSHLLVVSQGPEKVSVPDVPDPVNVTISGFMLVQWAVSPGSHTAAEVPAAIDGLGAYFRFYNEERLHQSLAYRTPAAVYHANGAVSLPVRPVSTEIHLPERATHLSRP